MSNNKNIRHGFVGKGYYIALILCAAAIGITGYLYYRTANAPVPPHLQVPSVTVGATEPNHIAVIAPTQPRKPDPTLPSEQPQKLRTAAPVEGEILAAYAMDALSYNKTTQDWRVHNGVDIAAPADTPVTAAADGVVYTVYEDDTMGHTVVIRHEGGYTTKYSSLGEEISVSAGDTVRLGDQIGVVGTSALLESALDPHVHFCVTKDDHLMDPAVFLENS